MNYSKEFFEINLRFAQKVAEVTSQPFEDALLHYTNLYIRFDLGRDFNSTNTIWQEYLRGLHHYESMIEWTHRFYLRRQEQSTKILTSPFGCFSYTLDDSNRIRLHFHNNDTSNHSPLCKERVSIRLDELANMFTHIKQNLKDSTTVIGASWLYNIESYRRLFPQTYLATAQISRNNFPYLPLWGQFVDRNGGIKENLARGFLERLVLQNNLGELESCFPFQVLHLESSVQEFYSFYGT